MRASTTLVVAALLGSLGTCGPSEPAPSRDQEAPAEARPSGSSAPRAPLAERWDLDRPEGRLELPGAVVEASGLAFTADGTRLLVHGDEAAAVVVIDPVTGRIEGRFDVGRGPVEGDFEGVAAVGPRLFLVTSPGLLYEFRDPGTGGRADFRLTDTRVADRCEVEGLDHDRAGGLLVLACKTVAPRGRWAVLERVPVDPEAPAPGPVRIALAELEARGHRARLHPSGVVVDPAGGFLVVAAREGLLVDVAPDGTVRSTARLDADRHPQAEGLEVGPDGRLWVADEAAGRDAATLTWYAPRRAAGDDA